MGAQQSSSRTETADGENAAKTCYYELLAVDRQASDEDIKKAYRRKALELHPDRNRDNIAIATQRFAEIQTAYEVLSDPQERAWYDSHREAILNGHDEFDAGAGAPTFQNVRVTTTEELQNLIRKFNATVPFNDEPNGFFYIARETFEHLALEEEAAADYDGLHIPEYPTFGSSNDNYDTVAKPFYSVWAGFTTRKSFSWKDKYRLSEAPDRRVRRLMEKENKKIRDEAMREFNDTVRFLINFVKKRDPRYLPNTQTISERNESIRHAAAAQAAKARAANQAKLASSEVPLWAQSHEHSADDDVTDTEEESEVEVFECIVCDKKFKSDKQLDVHEQSKKHIKAVQKLRWRMKKEGADLELEDEPQIPDAQDTNSNGLVLEGHAFEVEEGDLGSASIDNDVKAKSLEEGHEPVGHSTESSGEGEADWEEGDYATRSAIQDRLTSDQTRGADTSRSEGEVPEDIPAPTHNLVSDDQQPKRKLGKAKAKREKRAAEAATKQTNVSLPQKMAAIPEAIISAYRCDSCSQHKCGVCSDEFSSRTKLFDHIRAEDHATPTTARYQKGNRGNKRG